MDTQRIVEFHGPHAQTKAYGHAQAEMSLALVEGRRAEVTPQPHGDHWRVVVIDHAAADGDPSDADRRGFHVFSLDGKHEEVPA